MRSDWRRAALVVALIPAIAGCSAQSQQQASDLQKQAGDAAKQAGDLAKQAGAAAQNFATSAPAVAAKDALIVGAVKSRLAAADLATAQNVRVTVKDGTVTLTGRAPSEQERAAYTVAVQKIPGVKTVENTVVVDPKEKAQSTGDFALAAHVTAALAAQTGINALSVKVAAQNGTVTLAGTASSSVKDTMVATAKSVSGVRSVVDDIAVK